LLKELSDEIEDVHSIINEQDKKIERQRSEERQEVRRKKERDERLKKEEIEREENYEKEKRENNEKNKEKVLSIIGAATIPFALISGLMGMNTNLSECSMEGRIPCVSFWTVVGICFLLFFVIYFFLNRTLRSEEQNKPSSKKNNEPKLILGNNHEEITDLKTEKGELVTPSQSDS
jgi:Mg2+ and Co2+ transporter CorA